MAFSTQFLKLTWIFGIIGTDEIADTSLNYTSASPWTGAAAALAEVQTADLAGCAGDMINLLGSTGGRWADYSELRAVKCAAIGTDGHYLADPKIYDDPDPTAGTTIGNPAQCTTVLSLRSGFSIGGGNRGRMYLPHFYMSGLTASPFTDSTQAQGLATNGADFINAVTTDLSANVTATIFPAIMSQVGSGSSKGVTEVRVGNVTDTQRRRREQLPETYFTQTLA
jgi:hypothetical protein